MHLELCLCLECAWSYVGPMKCAWSYVCAFVLVFRVLGVGVTLFRVSLGCGTTKTKTAQPFWLKSCGFTGAILLCAALPPPPSRESARRMVCEADEPKWQCLREASGFADAMWLASGSWCCGRCGVMLGFRWGSMTNVGIERAWVFVGSAFRSRVA